MFDDSLKRDPAHLLAFFVLKNDLARVYQVTQPAAFRMGKHEPAVLHHLIGAVLTPYLIAAVAIKRQRGTLARIDLISCLHLDAAVFPRLGFSSYWGGSQQAGQHDQHAEDGCR